MDFIELGKEIKDARKARKLTITEVAAALEMSPATLSLLERGQATEIGLRRLMRVMECVGLEIVARPARMGYTLDDANEDLRTEARRVRP